MARFLCVRRDESVIELSNASFSYPARQGATKALDALDLSIPDGQFLAILGRNGSGKSTLARLLNGLLLPDDGSVVIDGLPTSDPANLWDIRRILGLVLSNPDSQIVATTVEEDVAFGLENLGVARDEMRARIEEALRTVGLAGTELREPHLLSGGQKQRLAIAGVLAMRPRHIVLDEATSMLDPAGRGEVLAVLRRLHDDLGVTIVLITHFVEEAADLERVIVLGEGRTQLDGRPADVLCDAAALRDAGILPPYATALAERLRAAGLEVPANIFRSPDLVDALCSLS